MGLDAGITLGIPRIRANGIKSSQKIEINYFRKCTSISNSILQLFRGYKEDEDMTCFDEYNYRLKVPISDITLAHELLYKIREDLSAEQDGIFELYGTENGYDYNAFWQIGEYSNIISSNLNSISMLILYLEKRIDFDELLEAIRPSEKEMDYIKKYIYPYLNEWDFNNAYINFYYSF